MNKNKDLPASPLMPMQDKFGQVVVMSGFSKQEKTALEIFKHLLTGIDPDDSETTISIGQTTFPFNLANEVRMLILESVLYYENEIIELKNKF